MYLIANLMSRLYKFFAANYKFILVLWLANCYTMVWYLMDNDRGYIGYAVLGLIWLGSLIITYILSFIPWKPIRYLIKTILIVPSLLLWLAEMVTMNTYKALIGTGIINSVLETNRTEAKEFIVAVIGPLEIIEAIICALVITIVYRFIKRKQYKLPMFIKLFLSFVLPIWTVASIYFTTDLAINYRDFLTDPIITAQRVYKSTSVAYHNMIAYHQLTNNINSNVVLTENNATIPNIVFILGEATNRNHMHLYGYNLPTTPNLDKLNAKGDIIVYTDVVSPHSTTIAVLSKLFTMAHYESKQPWYKYNNFIDIMNKAGYKTFWLSNQESSGVWGNVAQVYASHSSYHKFTRIRDSREDYGIVDGALFPLIDEAKKYANPTKNFYVIHLMGCHIAYYNRYPYAFTKFSANDIKTPGLTEDQKEVVAQYDNAVYYNDYVVSTIISKFKDSNTLVIYVPDHSEAVYDEGTNFNGHLDENANHNMIEIPVIFWGSPKFRAAYPQLWQQILASRHRPYMTDDMIHTLMDIIQVKTKDFDPTRSIINKDFNSHRPRIFNNKNYDLEIKKK